MATESDKKFLIYRSSAGSGKTFTLVKEYLKLALADSQNPPQHYKSILAITFTNKASAEMKERILKALRELSSGLLSAGTQTLLGLLISELNIKADEIKQRALILLHEILHNYADFAICTIDSFVHKVIRTFAYDLQLAVNFSIETDEREIQNQCIDELVSEIGNDPRITEVLMEFSRNRIEDNKNWQIDADIKDFAANVFDENNRAQLAQLKNISIEQFVELKKKLQHFIFGFENKLMDFAKQAFELLKRTNLKEDNFYRGNSGIFSYFKKILRKEFESDSLLTSFVQHTVYENKWGAGKNTQQENTAIDGISEQIKQCFFQIEENRLHQVEKYYFYKSVYKNIYALTVINEIEKLVTKFKEEQNILFISEFNNRISEVILKEPVPFIYERIGERYKHFLIDEFQDTSIVQWHNLLPLIDNSLAEGQFSMVVGDGKQSIYRWRGGEVEQFAELPKIKNHFKNEFTPQREQSIVRNHQIKKLNSNFRSRSEIVKFNNDLFRFFSNNLLNDYGKLIYTDLEQEFKPGNEKGATSIDFIRQPESKEEADEKVLLKIVEYIRFNLNKGFQYSDIAILVRFNKNGNQIADYLMKEQIPVVSSDSLLLYKAPEIAVLNNLLQYINSSAHLVAASACIAFLCSNNFIPKDEEHSLLSQLNAVPPTHTLDAILKSHNIDFNRNYFTTLPLFDCCVELINLFGLNELNPLYMQFFLDEVLSFTQNNSSNINGFMEWWEGRKSKASVILPSGVNAVNIMSIHASKGLEFPVVIMPYCDWSVKSIDYVWIDVKDENLIELPVTLVKTSKDIKQTNYKKVATDEEEKQILDNLNLLYVALTRPEHHLHIISRIPKNNMENIYKWLCAYLNYKGLYNAEEVNYVFGEWVNNQLHEEKKISANTLLKPLNIRNWKNIIRIKQASELVWNAALMEEKREHGVLLHYVLSKIKTINDASFAIQSCINEGVLPQKDREVMETSVLQILSDEKIKTFFDPNLLVKNEAEILTSHGQSLRPDRLVFHADEVIVIDYKTGISNKHYEEQLNKYAEALKELGYSKIKKYLIYIQEMQVEEII